MSTQTVTPIFYGASNSTIFNHTVTDFMDAITTATKKYLPGQQQSVSTTRPSRGFTYISPGPTIHHHHHHGGGRRNNKKMSDSSRTLIGILATGAMFVGSFLLGRELSNKSDTQESLKTIKKFNKNLNQYKFESPNNTHLNKLGKVSDAGKRIFKRQRASIQWGIVLKVSLIGAAVIGLLGAIAASPTLAFGGLIAGILVGSGMLLKAGIEWNDKKDRNDATFIKEKVEELKGALNPILV